jgi:SAM-dependent methyltransferase
MSQPEFDQHAASYDRVLAESMPDGLNESGYFAEYKVALVAARLKATPPARILDFGCGAGRSLPYLAQYFPEAELWGYDVSTESLKFAAQRVPQAHLFTDWQDLGAVRFDAIIAANVFHHIPWPERPTALQQCRQFLAATGQMFLFEHNPYNPLTRWVFEHCPFDAEARMMNLRTALALVQQAGFSEVSHGYTLFFPRPLAFLRGLEPCLKFLPLGAQYYVQMAK